MRAPMNEVAVEQDNQARQGGVYVGGGAWQEPRVLILRYVCPHLLPGTASAHVPAMSLPSTFDPCSVPLPPALPPALQLAVLKNQLAAASLTIDKLQKELGRRPEPKEWEEARQRCEALQSLVDLQVGAGVEGGRACVCACACEILQSS